MRLMTMDVHSASTTVAVFNGPRNSLHKIHQADVPTSIAEFKQFIEQFPGQYTLVMEEGPMASWLKRNLAPVAADIVVANPRHNALIYKGEDKDDGVDVNSLQTLYVTNNIKPVYHTLDLKRQKFKDLVLHYHDINNMITALKNKIKAFCRQVGVRLQGQAAYDPACRTTWLRKIRSQTDAAVLDDLYHLLDEAALLKSNIKRKLAQRKRSFKMIGHFQEVPGVGIVTAATFFAIIDTPWRFLTKKKLWKYAGLAVGNRKSNTKWLSRPGLLPTGNRLLKKVLLTAAHNCHARGSDNPMSRFYLKHILRGKTHAAARNATARKIAATLWAMWKTRSTYRAEQ